MDHVKPPDFVTFINKGFGVCYTKFLANGHVKNDFSCFPQPLGALFMRLREFIGMLMFRRNTYYL